MVPTVLTTLAVRADAMETEQVFFQRFSVARVFESLESAISCIDTATPLSIAQLRRRLEQRVFILVFGRRR